MKWLASAFAVLVIAIPALADHHEGDAKMAMDHVVVNPADIQWGEAPPSLPPGAKMAVLKGDPSKEGIFVVRLKAPDGYKVMPHWHPMWEHVTVISGTLNIGMGATFDKSKTKAVAAGGFVGLPPMMQHFAVTTGETVMELIAAGPYQMYYINPADDPSKQAMAK